MSSHRKNVSREEVTLPAAERSGSYEFDRFRAAVRKGPAPDETDPETVAEGVRVIAMMAEKEQQQLNG